MIEVTIAMALVILAIGGAAFLAVSVVSRERAGSAAYRLQSALQLARAEAVSRNRDCRMVLSVRTRELTLWDTLGTPAVNDDIRLHRSRLPENVVFDRPDSGATVSIQALPGEEFQTVFGQDGLVAAGSGAVYLGAAESFTRVTVLPAGGIRSESWHEGVWSPGNP